MKLFGRSAPVIGLVVISIPVPELLHETCRCVTHLHRNRQGWVFFSYYFGSFVSLVGPCRLGCLREVRHQMSKIYSALGHTYVLTRLKSCHSLQ